MSLIKPDPWTAPAQPPMDEVDQLGGSIDSLIRERDDALQRVESLQVRAAELRARIAELGKSTEHALRSASVTGVTARSEY